MWLGRSELSDCNEPKVESVGARHELQLSEPLGEIIWLKFRMFHSRKTLGARWMDKPGKGLRRLDGCAECQVTIPDDDSELDGYATRMA